MGIGATGEPSFQNFAHLGVGPVAAGEIGRFARLFGAIRSLEARYYSVARILKADQLDPALDLDPAHDEALDQEALVRERAQPPSHLTERDTSSLFAAHP
jgi:hypothetical protein